MDPWQDSAARVEGLTHVPRGVIAYARAGHAEWYPVELARGQGACAFDSAGRRYLDWVMGKGALPLGHAHEAIDAAAAERARRGTLLPALAHEYEAVAEKLSRLVPAMQQSIFAKNGSDAVAIAMRLARVHTGRGWVLSAGYHGWDSRVRGDAAGARLPEGAAGVLDFGYALAPLDALLESEGSRVAAILVSPEPAFLGAAFLEGLRERAHAAGALLIVDEVRCGMRLAPGGAHERFGVTPDLVALSKGLTNGYPLSAVGGRAEVMAASERTFVFGTHYGEAVSLAAAAVCLELHDEGRVTEALAARGAAMACAMERAFERRGVAAAVLGPPSMPTFVFEQPADEARFYAGAAAAGVLFFQDDAQCPSVLHDEALLEETMAALEPVLASLGGRERLERPSGQAVARYAARRGIAPGAHDAPHVEATLAIAALAGVDGALV